MPQKGLSFQNSKDKTRECTEKLHEELSSFINEVRVIRASKTQRYLHKTPYIMVKSTSRERAKYISPLRETMRNRQLQQERIRQSKKDKNKREHALSYTCNVSNKKPDTKSQNNRTTKINQPDRKGILKNNGKEPTGRNLKSKCEVVEKYEKINYQKTTNVIRKKTVKFEDQQTKLNSALNTSQKYTVGKEKARKNSKFLNEIYKNITENTTTKLSEKQKLVSKNMKNGTRLFEDNVENEIEYMDQLNVPKECKDLVGYLTKSLNFKQPSVDCSINFRNILDNLCRERLSFTLNDEDILTLLSEDIFNIEELQSEWDDSASTESKEQDPEFSLECHNFIRNNFSFPVLAFGCISMICFLLFRKS